ncbi:hypothetical protein [Mycobacterium sp. SMC-4]|uniref:hypothetical protein n=1 Tax=Mycobacterium sp. SMC-4 TaxID=2857059 RepID=UPI003D04AAB4
MPTVIDKLCALSDRECRARRTPLSGAVLDYAATLEVFDVVATGRVLAVWTAALTMPRPDPEAVRAYRDAAFADFLDQLRCTTGSTPAGPFP